MENYLSAEAIWESYEAEKLAIEIIERAIWKSEYSEFVMEQAQKEASTHEGQDIRHFPDAQVWIKIAQWRAKSLKQKKAYEHLWRKAYQELQNMIQKIQPENWLIINPEEEIWIIELYKNPGELREKFRSIIVENILNIWFEKSEYEHEKYLQFKNRILSHLPPNDSSQ
jgi:hypothetical protein